MARLPARHDEPVHVELPPEQRDKLDMTDDEIHQVLPDAVMRHADENRDGELSSYVSWDQPVRLDHMHLLI